jgi:hypothetical protein
MSRQPALPTHGISAHAADSLVRTARDYVGDNQVQDTGYLTSLSIDGEYCLNTSSGAPESLSNVLRVDSNGGVLVKPHRRSSWLFF